MKNKPTRISLLLLALTVGFALTTPTIPPTRGWGLPTHMWMVDYAIAAMPDGPWKDAFEFFTSDLKAGSITPDVVFQDWDNHLYYPETGEHTAHLAVERYTQYVHNNFSMGAWEEGMFAAGILSHYFADPNIPVHTDEYWGGHSALETDINNHLNGFSLTIAPVENVTNPRQYLIDHAIYAHQFYDDCYALYPGSTIPSPSPLEANATFHSMIETQIERAVGGFRNLWYTTIQGLDAPQLPSEAPSLTVLIDAGHNNVYTINDPDSSSNNYLTTLKSQLAKWRINVILNEGAITPGDLTGVDLMIVTPPKLNFTSTEMDYIADWLINGTDKHLLIAGYSEHFRDPIYYPVPSNQFQRLTLDWLLANCSSHIQLNDDSVYHQGTYQPWYVDLTNILPGSQTFNITQDVSSMRMYSPCSLWFTDNTTVNVTVYGDPKCYQAPDVVPPPPVVIWDNVSDVSGGDRIPLMAVETIGDSRILVSGTTFFSDFDYGATDFDNDVITHQALEWLLDTTLSEYDFTGPTITDVSVIPLEPTAGQTITCTANVSDADGLANVTLYFQTDDDPEQEIPMSNQDGNTYQGVIPAEAVVGPSNLTVYIKAYDTCGNWRRTLPAMLQIPSPFTPTIPPLIVIGGLIGSALVAIVVVTVIVLRTRRSK